MSMTARMTWMMSLLLTTVLLLAGCGGDKLTKENFGKVKEGMPRSEVISILGNPTRTETKEQGGQKVQTDVWESSQGSGSVAYQNDKVFMHAALFK